MGIFGWGHYSITTLKHHTLLNNHNPPTPAYTCIPHGVQISAMEKKILNKTSKCCSRGKVMSRSLKFSIYKFHVSEIFRSFLNCDLKDTFGSRREFVDIRKRMVEYLWLEKTLPTYSETDSWNNWVNKVSLDGDKRKQKKRERSINSPALQS